MVEKTTIKPMEMNAQPATKVVRPPVVVIVGHVDHGKTTLLDFIRKSNVADREAGGITQATSAYEIIRPSTGSGQAADRKITFIDTPGHEAFGAMRSRGAQIADIAVLVVSAEEGMKPQTKEALEILQKSETPFVVAFTKVDRTGGNVDKARNDLMAAGVLLEGFGGQVGFCGVSGKTGEGVDELLELLLLTADLEELSYDPTAPAMGFILEARRDPQRGIESMVIIKDGTLRRGDPITTPSASGKMKILENFAGKVVGDLTPSAPAIVIGWESLPKVGEAFVAEARAESREPRAENKEKKDSRVAALGTRFHKALPLILKASDAGSLEALEVVLMGIDGAQEKGLTIIEAGVGDVSDGDVKSAAATGATIVAFKNKVDKAALNLAEGQSVRILTSKIVYDLEKAIEEFLAEQTSPIAGELEVLAVFNQEKLHKQLVGGRVTHGTFKPKMNAEIVRPTFAEARADGQVGAETSNRSLGVAKILTTHEKKTEIFQAEKGKEIGVVVGAPTLVMVGDRLVIKK